MAYVKPNFKTKKALKEAVKEGKFVYAYEPGVGTIPYNGTTYIEGPHGVHTWYAQVKIVDGKITEVK